MKLFITGGNGFIGHFMTQELASRGVELVVYDILPPKKRLPGVTYVLGTILDPFFMTRHMKGCDGVLHLAAMMGVQNTDNDILGTMTVNLQGSIFVLQAAQWANMEYLLMTSSSEVFGDMANGESQTPFNPKSCYAASKLASEFYLKGFHKEYGLDYNIVRFFNIYGPGQSDNFVATRFIRRALAGQAPQVYGDGRQVRSFCHVSDACRATADIITNRKCVNQEFNIGNDLEPLTILELAKKVTQLCGNGLEPKLVSYAESDRTESREIFSRIPDISILRDMLGYQPEICLDDGLMNLVEAERNPVEPVCA